MTTNSTLSLPASSMILRAVSNRTFLASSALSPRKASFAPNCQSAV
ncbi:MAG: hypothetical protein NUV99_00990 [Clostridia bacterium]|nr:hypothetical protein [Clostridia bacterium]